MLGALGREAIARLTLEDTGSSPDVEAAHQFGGLGGAVEVGDAADRAGKTGNTPALKDLPDALAELLVRLHNVMIAPRAVRTAWSAQ